MRLMKVKGELKDVYLNVFEKQNFGSQWPGKGSRTRGSLKLTTRLRSGAGTCSSDKEFS